MRLLSFLLVIFLLVVCGCKDSNKKDKISPTSDYAEYMVIFKTNWDSSNFPTNFPTGRHFSGLIGATHNDQVTFWEPDQSASAGIESMAETGQKKSLEAEIQTAKENDDAKTVLSGEGISSSTKEVSLEFEVEKTHSLVTLVSMVAPSPDWFVGVHSYYLYKDGSWVDEVKVDLPVYDSGTDDGRTYSSEDDEPVSHGVITLLTSEEADTDFEDGVHRDGPVYIGTFTFKRLK